MSSRTRRIIERIAEDLVLLALMLGGGWVLCRLASAVFQALGVS